MMLYIRQYIQDDILSGSPTIDFCFETYYYYYSFIENGYLVDLHTLGIDFDADSRAVTFRMADQGE